MLAQQIRHQRALIGTGGDHDIVGLDRAVGGLGDEAGAPSPRRSRVTSTPQRIGGATKSA